MQKYPMTAEGARVLTEELERLKKIDRPQIIEAIATARALGDLKENAEYHAAREQQVFIEDRISELQSKLSFARIIDIKHLENKGKVIFGATVKLLHMQLNSEITYQIVGEDEADLKFNKISYASPLGRALIGKHIDDTISVDTPGGTVEYEIIDVIY